MEENQKVNETEWLNLEVGTEELTTLKPMKVKILEVEKKSVGEEKKNLEKLNCICKHPDREETLQLSSIKYESKGKLQTVTLWINKDSKGLIRKGSALAIFLNHLNIKNVQGLVGKEIETTTDDKGYLCFKVY